MAGGYDGEIRIRTLIENGKASSQLLQLEARFQKTAKEAARLEDEMRKLEQQKIPTEEYANLENKLKDAKFILEQYNDALKNMPAENKEQRWNELVDKEEEAYNEILRIKEALKQPIYIRPEGLYQQLNDAKKRLEIFKAMEESVLSGEDSPVLSRYKQEAEKATTSIKKLETEMLELDKAGKAFSTTMDPETEAQYQKLSDKMVNANNQMSALKRKMEEVAAKEAKVGSGSKQIEKVGKAAKKSAGLMSTLLSRLEGITLSLFIFNWITKAFNAMVAAFKEGIQNMAKYSSDFNSRMSELKSATVTLKASLGTLAAPIVSAVIPAIVTLCNWITTAVNKMNELVAALSGKSTWTRAKQQQVDYAKSLNSTAGAAKKAAGALQGFDELNVINSNSSGGGGGSGASAMYEEVPTSDALIGKLQPFLDYLKQIKAEVIRGWDETWAALDIDSQIADIRGSIESIRGSLSDIFGNADLQAAADNFVMTLAYSVGQIGASVVSIGATIAQNIIGGIDLYLQQNSGRITEYLIRMFDIGADVAQLAGEAAEAFAFVFQAFGNEDGQQITANLIQIFSDIFGTVTLLGAQFRDDMLHFFIDPFVDNSEGIKTALEGILEVVADVTGTISDTVQHFTDGVVTLYDEHIHPLIQSLTDGLDEISAKFLEFWNTYVQPVLENISTKFHEVMEQHIQPMLDSFLGLLGTVIDNVKKLWEEVLVPVIEWIIENILPVLMPIIQSLIEGVLNFIGFVSDMVANIMDFLSGLIDFIVGIFTGDWEQAWAGIREMFSAIWNSMKLILSTIWNNMKDGVKAAISAIKGHISDSLHNIKGGWRESWTSMKTTVLGIFDAIKSGIKGKINSIISFVENMANSIITGVNKVLEALNSVGFDMPDWLGGGTFHPNLQTLPAVSIPRLANGGITTGSTLVNIGEAGNEAVLPLENNLGYLEPLAEMIASKMERTQIVKIVADESGLFKAVRESANDYYRRTGRPAFDF
jgi:phage-related protein